jgi:hypothetical protein
MEASRFGSMDDNASRGEWRASAPNRSLPCVVAWRHPRRLGSRRVILPRERLAFDPRAASRIGLEYRAEK